METMNLLLASGPVGAVPVNDPAGLCAAFLEQLEHQTERHGTSAPPARRSGAAIRVVAKRATANAAAGRGRAAGSSLKVAGSSRPLAGSSRQLAVELGSSEVLNFSLKSK